VVTLAPTNNKRRPFKTKTAEKRTLWSEAETPDRLIKIV
jgi:hypothetical protein